MTTTTDIGQVPAACAALWAPYGVTKVPPVTTGQVRTIAAYASAGVTFFAGHVVEDPMLGTLWFTDGAGNCQQGAPPNAWCAS